MFPDHPCCRAGSTASFAVQEQQPDFSQLEKVVLEELRETNTPGATVAIVSGERVIYTKAFGISNVETGAPMTPDMLFRIGSTTKMFTALALVTLAEDGKLKLDEAIGRHVDGLNPRIAVLTAHQLLTHTAHHR
jgi:CubicO group peptidase (beta-lactamase class C family)